MGNSFIRALFSSIKAKITPIVTRVRLFLTPQFWRTKAISKFRQVFSKIFDVRPKHKDDYYGVGRYLVSKRLAYAIVLAIGVLSLVYLVAFRGAFIPTAEGIKTYKYNSVLLRFVKSDKVIITGKGGYKAYEGAVERGTVKGQGKLFNREGQLVYQGNFETNKYNGQGRTYYPSGNMCYNGEFVENAYEGEGKIYRDSGSLEYQGEFSQNMKNGQGTLYDESSSAVYTGEFASDKLVYSSLLGLKATEVREKYTGDWVAYQYDDENCVYMQDISAIYVGESPDDSVTDEVMVGSVYVLSDRFFYGDKECRNVEDLRAIFGEPVYHGNSNAILPEAIAIDIISNYRTILNGDIQIDEVQEFKESISVEDYTHDYKVYLYTYERDGLQYTFVSRDAKGEFAFYAIAPIVAPDAEAPNAEEEAE